jgi:hypothetical protein
MKQILVTIAFLYYSFTGFGQSAAYDKSMTELSAKIQATHSGSWLPMANSMERIATAEPSQWLPAYWVAYCLINESHSLKEPAQRDQILQKAESYLAKAEALAEQNAEILILKANYAQAMLSVDPMSRWEKYGAEFGAALQKASEIEPKNPRIPYLMGTNLFYTPEGFGGGKKTAKPYFEMAKELFAKYPATNSYAPSWGAPETEYFLGQCQN